MAKTKTRHSGTARGLVEPGKHRADIRLEADQALSLIKHLADAVRYADNVTIEAHWGRRRGKTKTHLIKVYNP